MRVLIAGFKHETNVFAPNLADWDAFERGEVFPPPIRGPEMLELMATVNGSTAGFMRYAKKQAWDLVPGFWCGAVPSSYITTSAFEHICDSILVDVSKGGFDAIYLELHGAGVAEHVDDAEGELIARVRQIVGPDIPIVASLDLHANVTVRMLDLSDAIVSFRTYPHIDYVETGELAAELLARRLRHGRKETMHYERVPFMIPVNSQSTTTEPAAGIYRELVQLDRDEGTIASFCMGFPYADFDECAPMIWAYGERAKPVVDKIFARAVAPEQWRLAVLSAHDAVQRALDLSANTDKPIVLADTQDNPGGGGTGATTGMLHALIALGAGRRYPGKVALGVLYDEQSAALAVKAGVGATLKLELGTAVPMFDGFSDPAVSATVTVRSVSDGMVVFKGPKSTGFRAALGPSACVEVEGILVVLASGKIGAQDRELFRFVGIDPERMRLIVVKSTAHFRADFTRLVADEKTDIIIAKAKGPMAVDPGDLPWKKIPASIRTRP